MQEFEFDLGSAIKKIRKEKGLKGNHVSKLLMIHPSTLSKYESNKRKINANQLPSLAEALGVTVDYIFEKNVDVTPIKNSA